MADGRTALERRARLLMGLVAVSGLLYPLLLSAVQLVVAHFLVVDVGAIVLWLAVGVACSVALVAAVLWVADRRVGSPWLMLGLAPPLVFELWLVWPRLAS